ncbi:serine/threonine-protein kinase NLK isoform X1, partial [Biomphalaria glabrata]
VLSAQDILQPGPMDFLHEIFVVTELMQSDLHKIIVSPQPLTSDHVKVFLYQILRGLKYLHSARVLHRDIKPGNLLVNSNCCLKICDFGLARIMEPDESIAMTQEVVTQYYRAPEILMGAVHYSSAVDIWSVGCIFAELLSRRILFQASAPVQQLDRITEVLGTPSFEDMPTACQGARDYIRSRPHKPAALNQFYTLSEQATHEAVHLLCRMLVLNPNKRITAADALTHPYLDEGRLRFHSCMCTCCTPGTGGRNFCGDLEPNCTLPFDYSFEKSLTNVSRVKEKLYKFIIDHQHRSTNKLPLCLNPHGAALAKIQSVVKGGKSWQMHSQASNISQRSSLPPYAAV